MFSPCLPPHHPPFPLAAVLPVVSTRPGGYMLSMIIRTLPHHSVRRPDYEGVLRQLPPRIIESAIVDGCSVPAPVRIVLPVGAPGSLADHHLLWTWNEFVYAFVFTSTQGAAVTWVASTPSATSLSTGTRCAPAPWWPRFPASSSSLWRRNT